jgi:hypothetical protein
VFKDAVQDLCEALSIRRINVLFDEAAHIFRPEQQRQFFTLFRDLRSPYMTCNAAVYPGVTSYGPSFEAVHDAQIEPLHRDINTPAYLDQMREIVFKQADSQLQSEIVKNGENFDALAYAVTDEAGRAPGAHRAYRGGAGLRRRGGIERLVRALTVRQVADRRHRVVRCGVDHFVSPERLASLRRSGEMSMAMTRAPMATANCVADRPTGPGRRWRSFRRPAS